MVNTKIKNLFIFCSTLTGVLLLYYFFIYNNQPAISAKEQNYEIEVTDFRGKTIGFNKPVERIVCLIESALTGLYMLEANDLVVGVSTNIYDSSVFDYYAKIDPKIKNKEIPAYGNWDFVNIESVISLQPDLVIMWASQVEAINALESRGIPVYGVMLHSFEDVYKEIRDFGILTGKNERAEYLVEYSKNQISELKKLQKNIDKKKSVYFMWAQGPLETSGRSSTVNELITLAGAKNACIYPDEHITVNLEKVIEWNPDVILMWYNKKLNSNDILKLSGWRNINAVKNNAVFELPSVFLSDLWTLKFPFAIQFLMKSAYPQLQHEINLQYEKQKIFRYLYNHNPEEIIEK